MQDRGLLEERSGRVALKPGAEVPLPDSIGALIAARLDLLSADRKALLADAAVVGRSFWAGAVAAVGQHDPARVYEGLMELVAKELVRPERASSIEGEAEFAFVHALVCDVSYSRLTLAERATKHARLARWLEDRTAGRTEDMAEVLAFHYGTALEMAGAAGLFELQDELAEPTTHYLELAGGRAAPLDANAAAAHFARAERVAGEAAKPKRRFFLSRRARRTLKRRAPLLVAAVAVIAVSAVAGLAVWRFGFTHAEDSGQTRMTPDQIMDKYGSGVVQITAKVPLAVDGKIRWETRVGSGFVAFKEGLIVTSAALVTDAYRRGPMVRGHVLPSYPIWVTCELLGGQGQYVTVRGYVCAVEATIHDCALIAVDPRKAHLTPIPLGDASTARVGDPVVALHRWWELGTQLTSTTMNLTAVWRDVWTGQSKNVTALRTNHSLDTSGLGAPLIDTGGKVIGWVGPTPWLCFNDSTGDHSSSVANSAHAVSQLGTVVDSIGQIHGGRKTWLDVYGTSVDWPPKSAKALGLPVSYGYLVQIVDPGGPAARAGIRGGDRVEMVDVPLFGPVQYLTGGDIIVAIDGKPVRSEEDYYKILAGHEPGETVRVKLYRGHRLLTVKARLAAYPYTPATG